MVHLLTTREGNLCGEPGKAYADINLVTCPECRSCYETEEQRLEEAKAIVARRKSEVTRIESFS